MSERQWSGIHVMTMHKAKGKEFTEVIVYDGRFHRILWEGASDRERVQAKLTLRVSVTRAMQHATIMTPDREPCPFL